MLDQGLPRSAASRLREAGEDVWHVGEIGLQDAIDLDILKFARAESRIVVTLDADFHSLLAFSGEGTPSCVRIREEGLTAGPLAQIVLSLVRTFGSELQLGSVVSVSNGVARIRRLPL